MTSDVLLVNPPDLKSKYKRFFGIKAPPLGLAYIAAVLEENDIGVEVLDCAAEDIDFSDLREVISKKDPLIVGVTSTTPIISEALKAAKVCSEELSSKIVLGGPHPSFTSKELMEENEYVDYVVRGEGEKTFLELYSSLTQEKDLDEIMGLTYRKNGEIHLSPDRDPIENLDSLPFPARHLLPNEEYKLFDIKMPLTTMVSSRGCPMQCSFCASSALHGKRARRRSPKNVVDEMQHVKKEHGIKTIAFMDDTFTLFPGWIKKFTSLIERKELDIGWGCTARVDKLNKEILEKMKEAGCHTLFFGVESGVQDILDKIKKGTEVSEIKKAFKTSREIGYRTIASLALGLPGETKENAKKTIDFVKKIRPDYALFSIATPYPGTRFYEETREKGIIEIKDWSKYNLFSSILDTELGIKETKKLQKQAFKEFYLRPKYIIRELLNEGLPFLKVLKTVYTEVKEG